MKHSLQAVILLTLLGCEETLTHNIDEASANQIVLALHRTGIPAQKSRDGTMWSVNVPGDALERSLQTLEQERVLSPKREKQEDTRSGLFTSREERQQARSKAVAGDLAETLTRLPGVLEARVHLFGDAYSSASVLLLVRPRTVIDENAIKGLIGGASGVPVGSINVVSVSDQRTLTEAVPITTTRRLPHWIWYILAVPLGVGLLLATRDRLKRKQVPMVPREVPDLDQTMLQ